MIATHSDATREAGVRSRFRLFDAVGGVSENRTIAAILTEISSLLADQGASTYRVHAYQNASRMLGQLRRRCEMS